MAYTLKGYSRFPYNLLKGNISDLSANGTTVVKCALLKSTYTPNQDSHDSYADISSYEITDDPTLDPDSDYPAGGLTATLLGSGASVSVSGRVTKFDASDPTLADCTMGAYKCVFYDATPASASDKKLIAYCDFGGLKSSNDGTYTIVLSTAGLFTLTVPA